MKRLLVTLTAVSIMMLSVALPAYAEEERSITASVTVAEIIAFTIIDNGDPGLNFGTVAAGTENAPELAQDDATTPALELVIGPETNCDNVVIAIRGETSSSLGVKNWSYGSCAGCSPHPLSPSYNRMYSIGPPGKYTAWWWLDIPRHTPPGTYNCTVSFIAAAEKSG